MYQNVFSGYLWMVRSWMDEGFGLVWFGFSGFCLSTFFASSIFYNTRMTLAEGVGG